MDKKSDHRWPEPANTKPRGAFRSTAEARAFLDAGGHLEADEEALYRHMDEAKRRILVMMPVMLSVGITHMRENMKLDVGADLQTALDRSAQLAIKYLDPVTKTATVSRIVADAQSVLVEMNADSMQQSVLAAAFLTLAFVESGAIADTTAQCVLASMAILEEAEADAANGVTGTWFYEPGKLGVMSNKGATKLSLMGYL